MGPRRSLKLLGDGQWVQVTVEMENGLVPL